MLLARSTQIAANLWQFTTATNSHFAFNCYLIVGDKTALIHTGKPSQFNQMLKLLEQALAGQTLDYVLFSHVEADECGALATLFTQFQNCQVVCNKVAAISLNEMLQNPPRVLKDGESLSLGQYQLTLLDTAHFPHNWDGHLWYCQELACLFSSDYCSLGGIHPPTVQEDLSQQMLAFMEQGNFITHGAGISQITERLAHLPVQLIATMHGPATQGHAAASVLKNIHNAWLKKAQLALNELKPLQ